MHFPGTHGELHSDSCHECNIATHIPRLHPLHYRPSRQPDSASSFPPCASTESIRGGTQSRNKEQNSAWAIEGPSAHVFVNGLLCHGALEVMAQVDGVAAAAARAAGAKRSGPGRVAAGFTARAQVQAVVPLQRWRRMRLQQRVAIQT